MTLIFLLYPKHTILHTSIPYLALAEYHDKSHDETISWSVLLSSGITQLLNWDHCFLVNMAGAEMENVTDAADAICVKYFEAG